MFSCFKNKIDELKEKYLIMWQNNSFRYIEWVASQNKLWVYFWKQQNIQPFVKTKVNTKTQGK